MPDGKGGSLAYYNWFLYEFWRFVFVQQEVGKAAQSFIEFPPMQKGASFNMAAVKAQIEEAIAAGHGKKTDKPRRSSFSPAARLLSTAEFNL